MTLPTVSFIIPTLKRPEGLKRCVDSIKALNYPQDKIDIWIREDEPHIGVPKRVKEGVAETIGEYIVYASNDCEFTYNSLFSAITLAMASSKGLIGLNTGEVYPDRGNELEHFVIKRSLVDKLDNKEVFCTQMFHCGVDNFLLAQCEKLGEYIRCEDAKVIHHHFTKGAEFDEVYKIAWNEDSVKHDRELLKQKLEELKNRP